MFLKKNTLDKLLGKFKYKTNLLLVSPENEFESLSLHKKLSKIYFTKFRYSGCGNFFLKIENL